MVTKKRVMVRTDNMGEFIVTTFPIVNHSQPVRQPPVSPKGTPFASSAQRAGM